MKPFAILVAVFVSSTYASSDEPKSWQIVPAEPRAREGSWFAMELPGFDDFHGITLVRPWRTKVVVGASMRKRLSRSELARAVKVLNDHRYMNYSGWRLGAYGGPVIGRYVRLADQEAVDAAARLTRERAATLK